MSALRGARPQGSVFLGRRFFYVLMSDHGIRTRHAMFFQYALNVS